MKQLITKRKLVHAKTNRSLLILLALLMQCQQYLFAQSNHNPTVLTLSEDSSEIFIGHYFYHLKDYEYAWNINDILTGNYTGEFQKSILTRSNFGNEQLTIWNKLSVTNQTNHPWFLDVGVYTIDSLIFYLPNGVGGYNVIKEGRGYSFKDKKYKSNSFLIDLDIPQGDTVTIYFKVCAFIMQYPSQVYTTRDFINMTHQRDLVSGLFLGIMTLVFFYNFFIWISTRDKDYLFYTIYIFFGAIMAFELSGLAAEIFFLGPLEQLNTRGPLIVAVASITSIIFGITFLETKRNSKKMDFVLRYIIIPLLLITCVMDFMEQKIIASLLNQVVGVSSIFILSAAAIFAYRNGFLSARYFILAKIFYFAGVIVFVLKTFAILPYTVFNNHAIETGLALEMVFFSFALADKLNQYKNEKENAIRKNQSLILKQNEVLEETVALRTHDFIMEKERSDRLLLNIFPSEIAEELKDTGKVEPKIYDSVTVLFSDFKNFTEISSGFEAAELIFAINVYFKEFDAIMARHRVEKIKTIGDAYMAASGFILGDRDAYKDVILAAIEMQQFVEKCRIEYADDGMALFQMRVGIHIGSVVAGVVGDKKFQYDLWGDAVNTAARMEVHGDVDKVNISEDMYAMVANDPDFIFEERIQQEVKGKGMMKMYFVALKQNYNA